MIDIDFISGTDADPDSTKSYDAIAIRFKESEADTQKVIVIDGGFSDVGNDVVNFIQDKYGAMQIDLMISTHPDTDHLNGLVTIIQQMPVAELMVHQPGEFRDDLSGFTNLDNLNLLLGYAADQGTVISGPFTGESRFNGVVTILGPTLDYYSEMLSAQLDPVAHAMYSLRNDLSQIVGAVRGAAARVLTSMPEETLDDGGKTTARNNSSVITLIDVDGHRCLFTGDAGIQALEQAADEYEAAYGPFDRAPLQFFQAPHHGSHRNLGKSILNRIFGVPGVAHSTDHTVFVHAVKASTKHPSPKVTNALLRRGTQQKRLGVTNGSGLWHHRNSEPRGDYSSISPYPILEEDEE